MQFSYRDAHCHYQTLHKSRSSQSQAPEHHESTALGLSGSLGVRNLGVSGVLAGTQERP